MYNWSTDQVDPKDRFDYWREVRAKGLFGVTAELEPEQRHNFSGEFSLRKFDGAGLIDLRASPYHVERSATDIANAPGGSLCIYQQLGGGGWFGVNGSGDFTIAQRQVRDQPFGPALQHCPARRRRLHLRILKIPVADLPPLPGIDDLVPKPFRRARLADAAAGNPASPI